jgi:hypothetical protein
LKAADFVIQPDIGFGTSPSTAFFVKARQAGETSTRAALPALFQALSKNGSLDGTDFQSNNSVEQSSQRLTAQQN